MAPVAVLAAVGLSSSPAFAATSIDNACVNSLIPTQSSLIPASWSATASPASVAAGGTVTLSGISVDAAVPPDVFVAGYGAGVLTVGTNVVPVTVAAQIHGSNTVQGNQTTNTVSTTATTVITDPDGTPGTGDETATPGTLTASFNNQTWTAGSSGAISFSERADIHPANATVSAGMNIVASVGPGGVITARFACSPGTVVPQAPPSTIVWNSSPSAFASSSIIGPLSANAGTDQTVAPGDTVTLHGSATGGVSPYSYAWTQTGGSPTVSLTGANTATPSFTAPTVSTTTAYTFQLQVTDNAGTIATDSVVVNDSVASPVCSDPASQCTDVQNFKVTVAAGTLVISTPYTATNPFDLGTMKLDPSGTFLHAQADFGNTANLANGVTITDTRAGALPWTAQVSAGDFTFSSNSINSCNLGMTGTTPQYLSGNALGPGSVVTIDNPNGGSGVIAAPGATCSTGLKGGPHTFATAAHGTGSVYVTGVMDLYAPSSTPAGTYNAVVTFTIS
jgi:hypothetical protein